VRFKKGLFMSASPLPNFVHGQWLSGRGPGTPLFDPVRGDELVRVDATGLDLPAAFAYARETGGAALRAMTYAQRAAALGEVVKVLQANRDTYYDISTANSGTVKNDTAVDVDGGIFTLGLYAKLGAGLGERHFLLDGEMTRLGKDPGFQSQHICSPRRGVALFINAFNFPSWGLWEKAAPALLSGMPIIVKPATATAWLTQRMVSDVVSAGLLPAGAISIICGSSAGLLDQLQPFDVVSFTGSAATAEVVRSHPNVVRHSVRVNIEADSVNSALLLPGHAAESAPFELLVKEVAREMTVKSGQKCTAIRRILVPAEHFDAAAQAIGARLAKTTVGDPRNETVRMGAVVSREQKQHVINGVAALRQAAQVVYDGGATQLIDASADSCCVRPTLLGARDASPDVLHQVEVFGPVATLMAYQTLEEAHQLIRRGQGSLVASVYGEDPAALAAAATELAPSHGRVHVLSPDVAALNTGHGNVMPQSVHGGPGRAGGGEELGGLRALNFYHQRSAIQAATSVLQAMA
jgi:3,4-dehydroadipyl-CoA semialdehyde dehydrogenase